MEQSRSYAVFSNRLDELAKALYEALFSIKEPFARRSVIVYDVKMKNYLYHFFAMHCPQKVAFGMEVITLSEAIRALTQTVESQIPLHLPSRLELSIKIEERITSILLEECDDLTFQPLKGYIGGPFSSTSSIQRRKIIALSEELSDFFYELTMQPKHVIDLWLEGSCWQRQIWRDIFCHTSLWGCADDVIKLGAVKKGRVFLFGFSFIPEIYQRLFSTLEVHYYIFSPSEYFLEDLLSDRERVFLQKVLEGKKIRLKIRQQLDMYLIDGCSLVGNWGKVGREFLKNLAKKEPFVEERYISSSEKTLLSHLQNDILYLSEKNEPCEIGDHDRSLQLHGCFSRLREVEVLFEIIMRMMHDDPSLMPHDILVLTPSLSSYQPLIHQVFALSKIQYRILDTKYEDQNDPLVALKAIFGLREKRFSVDALIELFSLPPFRLFHGFDARKLSIIRRAISDAQVAWGYDDEQRSSFIKSGTGLSLEATSCGSWERGLERLIAALIFADVDVADLSDATPYAAHSLDWSEAELLGKLHFILTNLADDIDLLHTLTGSFDVWTDHLSRIRAKYLGEDVNCPFLKELKRMRVHFTASHALFSLESFQRILSFVLLKKRESFQGADLSSVTFCSLEEGAVLPSKVICFLGMHEDSFPRKEKTRLASELSSLSAKNYRPTKQEEDRYLFLQAILSASQTFIVMYTSISEQDHKEQHPSSSVVELFSYIEKKWGEKTLVKLQKMHPSLSFHRSYFTKEGQFFIYSKQLCHDAQCYYGKEKKQIKPFIDKSTSLKAAITLPSKAFVSLQDLARFARHPVKFFMQHVLDMYLPSLFQREEKEFILPAYEKSRLIKETLKEPIEKVLVKAKKTGALPLGVFETLAKRKIEQESRVALRLKNDLHIEADEISSICFLSSGKGGFPLVIEGPSGTLYHIEGVIDGVCPQGLIFHGEKSMRDLVSIWPTYLAFLCYCKKHQGQGLDLILTREGSTASFDISSPERLLGAYLDYFYDSLSFPSFLMPSWAEAIFHSDIKALNKIIEKKEFLEIKPFPDDYLRWVFLRDPSLSIEDFLSLHERIPRYIFEPLVSLGDKT